MTDEVDFIWNLVYAGIFVVVIAVFFETVASTGLAPEPGDHFYVAWLDVTRYGEAAFALVIPGAAGALFILREKLDGGR
ncbi:hypothetical protein [Halobacterium yunchengense]|uniref:hypothetical protein n=1 Tax=Halobacterium yunchengense TaxID=3108497 RepID=UPI00300A0173